MTALQFILEPVVSPFRDAATLAAFGLVMGAVIVVCCFLFLFCLLVGSALRYSQEPIEDTIAYAEQRRGERR